MTALWITEADVAALLDLRGAIAAVETGLVAEASGAAQNMLKTHVQWGGGSTLHAIGAAFTVAGVVGTKTWAHTAGGATPLLILFDADSGALRAVIEAFALGQLRTGAAIGRGDALAGRRSGGRAGDHRHRPSGDGAGGGGGGGATAARGARLQPDARRIARRSRRACATCSGIEARAAATVAEAVDDAPLVTLVTRAREPFLRAAMLARGAHVNAVGAITLDRVEFSTDVFARCGIVAADSVPAVQHLSREFQEHYGSARRLERGDAAERRSSPARRGARRRPT